jgi:hypothetical protein
MSFNFNLLLLFHYFKNKIIVRKLNTLKISTLRKILTELFCLNSIVAIFYKYL